MTERELIDDFIKSDYVLTICQPYAKTFLKNEEFFKNSPHIIKMLYWDQFFELLTMVVKETLHKELGVSYDLLIDVVTTDYIHKLNPKLCDSETYKQ